VTEGQSTVRDDAFDLMELCEVRRVQSLVAEDAIDGEEFRRAERLLQEKEMTWTSLQEKKMTWTSQNQVFTTAAKRRSGSSRKACACMATAAPHLKLQNYFILSPSLSLRVAWVHRGLPHEGR
jgi:hypothetical protein